MAKRTYWKLGYKKKRVKRGQKEGFSTVSEADEHLSNSIKEGIKNGKKKIVVPKLKDDGAAAAALRLALEKIKKDEE